MFENHRLPPPILARTAACLWALAAGCGDGGVVNAPQTTPAWLHLQSVGALDRPSPANVTDTPWQLRPMCWRGGTAHLQQTTSQQVSRQAGQITGGVVSSSATIDFDHCRGVTETTFHGRLSRVVVASLAAEDDAGGAPPVPLDDRLSGVLSVETNDFSDPACRIDLVGTKAAGVVRYTGTLCGRAIDKSQDASF